MQHHISLCFFSGRALQQSGQRWGEGGAEKQGEYQVEKKDEVGVKACDGLSQRWRGVSGKYISSERLCAAWMAPPSAVSLKLSINTIRFSLCRSLLVLVHAAGQS